MHIFPNLLQTKYNENYFSQPYFLWEKCADDSILNKFISLGESLPTTVGSVGNNVVHEDSRLSTLSWINYNDESKDLFNFLIDKIDRINFYHYGMKLYGMQSIQYTRYPIGGHYKYHNDIIVNKDDSMRKLSLVMALTSKDSYEGGDLLISPNGSNPHTIRLDKGDLIAFPSYIPHTVTPVTSGNRISIVAWACGPKFV